MQELIEKVGPVAGGAVILVIAGLLGMVYCYGLRELWNALTGRSKPDIAITKDNGVAPIKSKKPLTEEEIDELIDKVAKEGHLSEDELD